MRNSPIINDLKNNIASVVTEIKDQLSRTSIYDFDGKLSQWKHSAVNDPLFLAKRDSENLKAFKRYDPTINKIIEQFERVTVYKYDHQLRKWGNVIVDGPLFFISCGDYNEPGFVVMNRTSLQILIIKASILSQDKVEIREGNRIIYTIGKNNEKYMLWFEKLNHFWMVLAHLDDMMAFTRVTNSLAANLYLQMKQIKRIDKNLEISFRSFFHLHLRVLRISVAIRFRPSNINVAIDTE